MPTLDAVPDEVIEQILYFVSPDVNISAVQLLSRRYHRLANEALLWRFYCTTSFQYWNPEHRFEDKLQGLASDVDWKHLWMTRRRRNSRVGYLLDGILATQLGRLRKFEQICTLGYDAKDFLLEQCRIDDDGAEDVLARRYYGKRALDSIHKGIAIELWSKLRQRDALPGLDAALGGYDMFVLHDGGGEIDEILHRFDSLASDFLREHPTFEDWTIRDKALALVRWLRANRLTGLNGPNETYRNLRNCLIGQAILGDNHASLPIISSAIYCCVAQRLGLDAKCCNFPAHVRVMVVSPSDVTLDGQPGHPEKEGWADRMFLDPFASDEELSAAEVRSIMRMVNGWDYADIQSYDWVVSSPCELVQRNALNILETCAQFDNAGDGEAFHSLAVLERGDRRENVDAMAYAASWALVLATSFRDPLWRDHMRRLLTNFVHFWSEDAWLVEKYVFPLDETFAEYNGRPRSGLYSVRETLGMARNIDQRRPTMHRRYAEEIHGRVRHRIGQVFRHKRYGFIGIINGWDPEGTSTLPPFSVRSRLEELVGDSDGSDEAFPERRVSGRGVFYTCMTADSEDRQIVRQGNVLIVTDASLVPNSLVRAGGRFFKRFDRESCTFVSNIKDYYPDD